MLSLTAERRDLKVSPENIRKTGKVPAVFYGPKEASTAIALDAKEFGKVFKKAGQSSVVILKDGADEHEVLIHDIDKHPLTGELRHADFYVIEKGKKIEVSVPLSFIGTAPAVKDKGGILVKVHREIEIEAAPRDLPHELTIDISKLVEFTDVIHASEIPLPKGVELKINPDEVVASIAEPKEEVEEAPAAIDMASIEVSDAKGKEVKEGEAPVEGAAAPAADAKKAPEKK